MLDLPKLLDDDLVERIYPFFERDHEEMIAIEEEMEEMNSKIDSVQSYYCNFEEFIVNPDLPQYASEQHSYHVMSNFIDYHNTEQELLCEVILKDPSTWDQSKDFQEEIGKQKKKKFEVEHSLIDFQKLIIGEKIRGV